MVTLTVEETPNPNTNSIDFRIEQNPQRILRCGIDNANDMHRSVLHVDRYTPESYTETSWVQKRGITRAGLLIHLVEFSKALHTGSYHALAEKAIPPGVTIFGDEIQQLALDALESPDTIMQDPDYARVRYVRVSTPFADFGFSKVDPAGEVMPRDYRIGVVTHQPLGAPLVRLVRATSEIECDNAELQRTLDRICTFP